MRQRDVKVMTILMKFSDKTAYCQRGAKSPSECHREKTEQVEEK